jgi:cytochrome c oxidase cbb3-type subunit 2
MALVAATYFVFLLFAQFAFLELLQRALSGAVAVRQAMAAMGVAGLGASVATARLLRRRPARALIATGFLVAAVCALVAPRVASATGLTALAATIGVSLALLTVSVATRLPALLPGPGVGLRVGLATGTAYFLCNLPGVFDAEPEVQSRLTALVCLLAAVLASRSDRSRSPRAQHRPVVGGPWGSSIDLGFVAVSASFLALVWLDSAAFAVIQESADLKAVTWGSPLRLMTQAVAHLVAAILAGRALDRGRLHGVLLLTYGLFALSLALLGGGGSSPGLLGPVYATGISLYSVALVMAPTLTPSTLAAAGRMEPRWRAALLFGVAGWIGSALGVGMAQDLHRVPAWFLVAAGSVVALGAAAAHRDTVRRVATTAAGGAVALALAWSDGPAPPSERSDRIEEAARRGRAVYIREGCISCHSQYVRPGTRDEELWGPSAREEAGMEADPADRAGNAPPLIGLRRQGPDLSNAGNRRSAWWHRQHLIDPRSLSPGSRMPAYAHLFERGAGSAESPPESSAGEDLVAYLSTLGAESARERLEQARMAPVPDPAIGNAASGGDLFLRHCSVCHGAGGRGDGPLGLVLGRPAMNLCKGSFWLVSRGPGLGSEAEGLERVIKFGVPGTSMPGHEYFSDQQIADLAAHVLDLAHGGALDGERMARHEASRAEVER